MAGKGEIMNDEEELLRRCARGDAAAYRELVERVEKPLVNFILRFVGERHVAEDLFQETFVRVVKTLATFRPEASLSTWISPGTSASTGSRRSGATARWRSTPRPPRRRGA